MKRAWYIDMIGPKPIDTVANCQKSGISHGCGYEESPLPSTSWRKFVQLLFVDPSFEKGARVNAGRGVALKEDEVAAEFFARRAEEVIESDVVQRRRRRKAGDVAAELRTDLVGPNDHRQSRSSGRSGAGGPQWLDRRASPADVLPESY